MVAGICERDRMDYWN